MGITFETLKKRLLGELDVIPASSIGDRINEALRDIYDSNDWGFLFTDAYIRTPALISGVALVEEFNPIIVLDATTKAIVNAIDVNHVPIIERQLRLVSPRQSDRGLIYNITGYDDTTGELTINPPFLDVDNSAAQIQILKLYYTAPTIDIGTPTSPNPVIDFKRFESIISSQFNRRLCLDTNLNELNMIDPYRTYSSDPQCIVPYSVNSNGDQLYELYPSPRFERILRIKYLRKGLPLVRNSDQVHDLLSQELIIERAKQKCYKWIMGNIHKLENVRSAVPYQNLIALSNNKNDFNSYPNLLERAIKADEERYPKAYLGNFADIPYYDFDFGNLPIGETLILNF